MAIFGFFHLFAFIIGFVVYEAYSKMSKGHY